jgi:hypothetical protein
VADDRGNGMTDDVRRSGPNGGVDPSTAQRSGDAGAGLPHQRPPVGAAQPAWSPAGAVPSPPPAGYPYGGVQPPARAAGKPAKHAAPWAAGLPATPPPPRAAAPAGYPGPAVPPPPAPSSHGPARGGGGRRILIAAVVLCLVAAGLGVAWYLQRPTGTEEAASPAASFGAPLSEAAPGNSDADATGEADSGSSASRAPSRSAATTAPATPTVDPEQQALVELETLRAESLPRLVLDDRWVAQVASKSVGITDPLQTAANGTHTFYAVDILAESRAATASVSASSVLVLRSTDFGKRSFAADGQAYWITLVDVGFTSSDQVKAWCAGTYPTLTAEQLANACAARTLTPPHD